MVYSIKRKKLKEKDLMTIEFVSKQKKFRNKKTGEIKTQISVLELKDYEIVKD